MRIVVLFLAIIAATPCFAREKIVHQSSAPDGYTVSGPHLLATPCHLVEYELDGKRYRRQECPGAPALSSIGMPADGCFNRAVCARASHHAKQLQNGTIVLY